MLSVSLGPKMIPLRGAHCIAKYCGLKILHCTLPCCLGPCLTFVKTPCSTLEKQAEWINLKNLFRYCFASVASTENVFVVLKL